MSRLPASSAALLSANLTPDQMRAGAGRLKLRIADLEQFDADSIVQADDPNVTALEASIEETLQRVFGTQTVEVSRYRSAAKLHQDWGVSAVYQSRGQRPPPSELQKEFSTLKALSLALLGQAVKGLEEDIAERAGTTDLVLEEPQRYLCKEALYQTIRDKVWRQFEQGHYDTAVFEAMKAVEVAVRQASGLSAADIGTNLMRKAFSIENGPLTDRSAEQGERQARSDLFAGAIGSYKNPHSHRNILLDGPGEAAEIIMVANHLLRIVDACSTAVQARP